MSSLFCFSTTTTSFATNWNELTLILLRSSSQLDCFSPRFGFNSPCLRAFSSLTSLLPLPPLSGFLLRHKDEPEAAVEGVSAWVIEQRQLDEDQRKAADADWEMKLKLKARDEVRVFSFPFVSTLPPFSFH